MTELHDTIIFASQAMQLAMVGAACWVIAGLALLADRIRHSRRKIDRVGWMPWTGIFLTFAVMGGGLLFMAEPAMLGGS